VPIAVTDDQRTLADAVRTWANRAEPVRVTRAHEHDTTAWRGLWAATAELGLITASVSEQYGGGGATLTEHATLLEAAATAMVPGPVLTTAIAAVVLDRAGCGDVLEAILAGATVGVALDAPELSAESSDGGLVVRGTVRPVLGADATCWLLLPIAEQWIVVAPGDERVKVLDLEPLDFSRPTAEVRFDDALIPAVHVLDVESSFVHDIAATFAAAEAAGIAAWCLETAVAYAKVREQFGKPIGSFQAIKHLCAQMLCRVETAAALAWDAAEAGDDERPIAAAAAAALSLEAAVDTAKDCIQVLGGIGFTWEHDAHHYLRRALALRQWLGGTAAWRRRVAELTLAGERRTLRVDLSSVEDERADTRTNAEKIAAATDQRTALAETGYLTPHWPAPYGLDATPAEQLLIDEELDRAGVARPDLVIAGWAIPTILDHGTPEQIERFVRPTLLGEITWCQLFSEPEAGSDLAALRTRADRVEGGWRLTGQKVWTSLAHRAHWGICLARTDPEAKKHKGISYFLVDMRSPGIEVRPLREITGEPRFNEVFLDDVFVPDDLVVGHVNDGWRLARTTLSHERVAIGNGSSIGEDTERLVQEVADRGLAGDSAIAAELGALITNGLAGSVLDLRGTLKRLSGITAGAESSVRKLIGVEHRQHLADLSLDVAGIEAVAAGEENRAVLLSRCLSIAGGTTQVLLSVAAEQLLGLPRG